MRMHPQKTDRSVAKTTRFFWLGIIFICLFACLGHEAEARTRPRRAAYTPPPYAMIIMDAQSGKTLDSTSADARRYPASLTKLMTLFLTFEALDRGSISINKQLNVSANATRQPPSRLGLRVGQSITTRQAISVLVTRSANDVAVALAETLGGSVGNFARMMNARASSLGMKHTHFTNPSGLPDRNQYTSARDMALLSRALMQYFPHYYHYFGTRQCSFRGQAINTHNRLMCTYPGMDGLKTGYIDSSGFNLAASAVRNNRRVIVVVFGGRTAVSRDRHVAQLLDRGFEMMRRQPATQVAEAPRTPPKSPAASSGFISAAIAAEPTQQASSIVSASFDDSPTYQKAAAVTPTAPAPSGTATADRSPPTPATTRTVSYLPTTGNGSWGIQVGAYGSAALGQQALDVARGILRDLPPSAEGVVLPVQTPRGIFYRARFLGMSAANANQACKRLRECMVFAMD